MPPNLCNDPRNANHERFRSPVAEVLNSLLWGDWKFGARGLLVRSPDEFDLGRTLGTNRLQRYMPASFLHASMRAPRPIYLEHPNAYGKYAIGMIFGTKYKANWVLRQFQTGSSSVNLMSNATLGAEGRGVRHRDQDDLNSVDCVAMYPGDSGSIRRGSLLDGSNGRGCHIPSLCVENNGTKKCLFDQKALCRCDSSVVSPHEIGKFYGRLSNQKGERYRLSTFISCWYDPVDVGDMVSASNAMWIDRKMWHIIGKSNNHEVYRGYTECPSTRNIANKNMVDAIVVKLPLSYNRNFSMCDVDQTAVLRAIRQLSGNGPGFAPIVFMMETQGMDNDECQQFWGGIDCTNGYRKEIFSQLWNFTDGSCITIPLGCDDPFYFPSDPTTGKCSIDTLPSNESFSCQKFHRELAVLKKRLGFEETNHSAPSKDAVSTSLNLIDELRVPVQPNLYGHYWTHFLLSVLLLLLLAIKRQEGDNDDAKLVRAYHVRRSTLVKIMVLTLGLLFLMSQVDLEQSVAPATKVDFASNVTATREP